jgi:hypothetical protein
MKVRRKPHGWIEVDLGQQSVSVKAGTRYAVPKVVLDVWNEDTAVWIDLTPDEADAIAAVLVDAAEKIRGLEE